MPSISIHSRTVGLSLSLAAALLGAGACRSSSSSPTTDGGLDRAGTGGGVGTGGGPASGTGGGTGTGGTIGSGGTATGGSTSGTGGAVGTGGGPVTGTGGTPNGGSGGGGAGRAGTGGVGAGSGGASGRGGASVGTGGAMGMGGQGAPVIQTTPGSRPALAPVDSFDGLSVGNPSDLSLAVGPNHIVQVVNWSLAVYSKKGSMYGSTGMVLKAQTSSNSIFAGFGGRCEGKGAPAADRGDVIVRYDQLAQRWVFVQPVFSSPYAMCYAVSTGPDPLGTYNRYEFARPKFPDYPRLGIWPDGYYVGSSTGDDVIEKTICVADRAKMIAGQAATEQCVTKTNVNFFNPADIDGQGMPPTGAPNIILALGGTQLKNVYSDDGIYVYKMHVDWTTPANTTLTGPTKIAVARYSYLCNGQLTSCVPQQGTSQRLDAQGDKLMQRAVYRNFGDHESMVVNHSVAGPNGGGGLRWYELRLDANREPYLYQQSTYAPDNLYRWLGSAAMDKNGNIGIGYSYGGTGTYPGQRFAARLSTDPLGTLGFMESVLAAGQGSQGSNLRWEDYATTVIDPSDDATFWYVGNYFKSGSTVPATRIASIRIP